MLSMSNQFYKFIRNTIIDYFQNSQISQGDRYYIQLDHTDQVEQLVTELKGTKIPETEIFTYTHLDADPYETFCFNINGCKLVIAFTSELVTPDYLVTLRNQVGEQEGDWENTALLSIVSEQLDSIQGGSSDLHKKGMPLHPVSLQSTIEHQLYQTNISQSEKWLVQSSLDFLMEDHFINRISLFDFKDYIEILSKGEVNTKDCNNFGLFKDDDLGSFPKKKDLRERVEKNRDLFSFVQRAHEAGSTEQSLSTKFVENGADKLKKNDWHEVKFKDVLRYYQKKEEEKKRLKVEYTNVNIENQLEYWEKPLSESAAGIRKRHFIIFNPLNLLELRMSLSFSISGSKDKKLVTKYFDKRNKSYEVIPKGLTAEIIQPLNEFDPTYFHIKYKHEDNGSKAIDLFFCVLPYKNTVINEYKSSFLINVRKSLIELKLDNQAEWNFGIGEVPRYEEDCTLREPLELDENETLTIKPHEDAFNEEGSLEFQLVFNTSITKFLIKTNAEDTTQPIKANKIWRQKREEKNHFILMENKLQMGSKEYYIEQSYKTFLDWEDIWIKNQYMFALKRSGEIIIDEHYDKSSLSIELRDAYNRYLNYFRSKITTPTLAHMSKELMVRAEEYVKAYINDVKSLHNEESTASKRKALMYLGILDAKEEEAIYFTPFHPLIVSYQLDLSKNIKSEKLVQPILERLNATSLVPYIYNKSGSLYKPETLDNVQEWIKFKPVKEITVSDAGQFLDKVVNEKIHQFIEYFNYLFIPNRSAPLKLNICNITNDKGVLIGIVKWMIGKLNKSSVENIIPIQVFIKNDNNSFHSAFDDFAKLESKQDFEDYLGISIRVTKREVEDVIRIVRENISYFKCKDDSEYEYAHISFYKMKTIEKESLQDMQNMTTGMTLNGLVSSVPSQRNGEEYRSGFGLAGANKKQNLITEAAYYVNELSANMTNGGTNTYRTGEAFVSKTESENEQTLRNIFNKSYWVTFIDPPVDLDYFQNQYKDLVVIHYSDQYTSSSRIDAVTVTDKSEQFNQVIKSYLNEHSEEFNKHDIEKTITAFNIFNGEWLLNIIGKKGHYDREKLSIISAIKHSLAYFNHKDIMWVPISLEEVLRVAGAVGLSQKTGIFTAKNLKRTGSYSDDLLLLGLEITNEKLKLHFYPIEVKIGINSMAVIDKAKNQISNTRSLLDAELIDNHEEKEPFKKAFHRNFFIQLFVSNLKKIQFSSFWPERKYHLESEVLFKLYNDDFVVSNDLKEHIGDGAILSFRKDSYFRSAEFYENTLLLNFIENDGSSGIINSIDELIYRFESGTSDLDESLLLSNKYEPSENEQPVNQEARDQDTGDPKNKQRVLEEQEKVNEDQVLEEQEVEQIEARIQVTDKLEIETQELEEKNQVNEDQVLNEQRVEQIKTNEQTTDEQKTANQITEVIDTAGNQKNKINCWGNLDSETIDQGKEIADPPYHDGYNVSYSNIEEPKLKTNLHDIRILLGKPVNTKRDIYWEYGNNGLSNRHLLISGKSGQGKTYFMQCLLYEKAKAGISSVVIDYTEGFLPNQLEDEFVESLNDNLNHHVVYTQKFPVNPFKKNTRDIGGINLPETPTDVAERIKSVFTAVYSLGPQQANAIYEATLNGLKRLEDQMSLPDLMNELIEDGSSYAKTALSRIRPLIDRDPFNSEKNMDWKSILEGSGKVNIIQLTGYPRDVQLIITEFILWDLWNYSVSNGNKNKPLPVIMDEAQNLDHSKDSPSAKILTEGRKFGMSGWYATQFLKSQLSADELARLQNSAQKVYFSPPEGEISQIAASLSMDGTESKQYWESKLANLKKGQCIVHGPIIDDNGQLTKPIVTIVNVASLTERMNK